MIGERREKREKNKHREQEKRKKNTRKRTNTPKQRKRKNNRGEGDLGASEHPEKLLNTGSVSTFFLRSNPFLEQLTPPV